MEISSQSLEPASPPQSGKRRAVRACSNCKTAKTKCIMRRRNENICDRCSHFTLQCTIQEPLPRKRREAKPSRVAELEQKLDNIVTLLSNSQPQQPHNSANGPKDFLEDVWSPSFNTEASSSSMDRIFSSNSATELAMPSKVQSRRSQNEPEVELPSLTGTSNSSPIQTQQETRQKSPSVILLGDSNYGNAEMALLIFQTKLASRFPFVVIPAATTYQQLRQAKPFLSQTVVLVASKQNEASRTEGENLLLAYLSEHLVVRGEKSLDLLQGLLVYIAWGRYQFHNNAQMSVLLQLAAALVVELGLDKAPRRSREKHQSLMDAVGDMSQFSTTQSNSHTSDERRAFSGCFYLSSILYQCYKKLTGLRHSIYLDQCCRSLEEAAEFPSDFHLVSLVRIQSLLDTVAGALGFGDPERPSQSGAPTGWYIKWLQREFLEIRESIHHDPENPALVTHLYSVEITLLEINLYSKPNIQSVLQLSQLSACLLAAKLFFETWFKIPASSYPFLTIASWAQIANSIVALSRLLFFSHRDWDLCHARSVADLPSFLDSIADGIEGNFVGNNGEVEDGILKYAQRLRRVKRWYERRLKAEIVPGEEEEITTTEDFLDLDEMLWHEFVNDWGSLSEVVGGL